MINLENLENILAQWSFWDSTPKRSITRQIKLPKNLSDDLVLIIQGVRRCGKSTLLTQIPEHYDLPMQNCFFCNFEDPRLPKDADNNLLDKIVTIARKKIKKNQKCYFFFDEIQHVLSWEKWLHVQLERPQKNYFIITGSNSALLSGEFGSSLTGRHITLELFPFSIKEYKKLLPKNNFENYLNSGGFPRAIIADNPTQLLQDYFNDIIFRDVMRRVNARSVESIRQVIKMAFESCGSELSYRKIAAVSGISVDTVKTYLEACEYAYLIFPCHFFAFSEKKRLAKQKKYYAIDTALRKSIISTSNRDLGKNLESLVFLHLKKHSEQVYYWQETHKGEVDFVTVNKNIITPYQVTLKEPEQRHYKALDSFYSHFPQAEEAVFINSGNAEDFLEN